jgi:hypothetical protein
MPRKPSKNKKKESSWLNIIPIIIAALSLLYSVFNGYRIEYLNRDVYVPRLDAKFETGEGNSLVIVIENNGLAAAKNITIELDWNNFITLSDCKVQPPYQDLQPIVPLTDTNISYRISGLNVDGIFKISCKIEFPNGLIESSIGDPDGFFSYYILDALGNPLVISFDKTITADNAKSISEQLFAPFIVQPTPTPKP